MAEWDADLSFDPEALRRAAGEPRAWRLLASGWDSDAWLAGETTVWRVPRRRIAIPTLRREAALLPRIAPRLPAPVPVPELVEIDGLPPLARHALVPGQELALAPVVSDRLGSALGRFLRALHDPALTAEVRDVLAVDPLGRGDPVKRVPFTHRRLEQVADHLDIAPLRPIVDAAAGGVLALDVVCHGDLHVRHVLVGGDGELAGVIDWGDACIGARAMDLPVVSSLEPAVRAAFFDAYGPVDEATWRHARMLAVLFGAALLAADPAGRVGHASRRWLERLVETPEGDR